MQRTSVSDNPDRDPEDVRIGATIKALREKSGLSCTELGRAISKSDKLIQAIERGDRHATPQVVRGIADTLQVALAAITLADYEQIRDPERGAAA
jgi:ribosome-binding protein aMBF1 (putative translation factor)